MLLSCGVGIIKKEMSCRSSSIAQLICFPLLSAANTGISLNALSGETQHIFIVASVLFPHYDLKMMNRQRNNLGNGTIEEPVTLKNTFTFFSFLCLTFAQSQIYYCITPVAPWVGETCIFYSSGCLAHHLRELTKKLN